MLTYEGEEAFLKMLFRDDQTIVAGAADFYIGLTDITPTKSLVLTDLVGNEPTTGSYARQTVARDATDWPTIDQINDTWRALSLEVTFTPSGADYDVAIDRFFLASTGDNSGLLLAFSAPLAAPVTILDGVPFPIQFAQFLD